MQGKMGLFRTLFTVIIGFVLFGILIYFVGTEHLSQLKNVKALPFILAILMTFCMHASVGLRWRKIVGVLTRKQNSSIWKYIHCIIYNAVLINLLPKELAEVGGRTLWLNKSEKIPFIQAGATVFWDRFFDLFILAVVLIGSIPFWFAWGQDPKIYFITILLSISVGFIFLVVGNIYFEKFSGFFSLCWDIIYKLPVLRNRERHKVALSPGRLPAKVLLTVFILSFLKFSFMAFRNLLFAMALGLSIPPAILLLGTPISQLTFVLSFTPGGLGIVEAGWLSILLFKGVPESLISVFLVGQRIITIVAVATVFLVAHIIYLATKIKHG
ncbi:MAG: flippase-like domain-containing protein [Thermodesulfobacteriota bacterium]